MSEKVYIYRLIDPRDNETYYIGKTINPHRRLIKHKNQFDRKTPVILWIKKLKGLNLEPKMEIVEICSEKNWEEKEIYWINYYRKKSNLRILNVSNGGQGGYTGKRVISEETRKKLRAINKGKKPSPQCFKALIESRKNWKPIFTKEWRKNISEGLKKYSRNRPKKHNNNISNKLKGRKLSPEHLEKLKKIAKKRIGTKLPREQVEKQRISKMKKMRFISPKGNIFEPTDNTSFMKRYKLDKSSCHKIAKGKRIPTYGRNGKRYWTIPKHYKGWKVLYI